MGIEKKTKSTEIIEKSRIRGVNVTLYRQGSNNVYYYFRYEKKTYRGSTGTCHIDGCWDKVSDLVKDVKNGKFKIKKTSLEQVFQDYLKLKRNIKKNSFLQKQRMIKYWLKYYDYKGKKNPSVYDLKTKDIYEYVKWRKSYYELYPKEKFQKRNYRGKKVKLVDLYKNPSDSTVKKEIYFLKEVHNFAQELYGNLQELVVHKVGLNEEMRKDVLSDEEYESVLKWMEKNDKNFYKCIIIFLNETGLRYPSETHHLKWKHIHFDEEYMEIRGRKNPTKKVDSIVPLTRAAVEVLKYLQGRNVSTGNNDYVFVNDFGKRIKTMKVTFEKCLKELSIHRKGLTMYSFRHKFTRDCIMKNPEIPMTVLARVLGHSSTKMIEERYGYLHSRQVLNIFKKFKE